MKIVRLDTHKDQRGWDLLSTYTGQRVFNIGANVGQAARVLARNYAEVIALEPCAESFAVLEAEMPDNVACLPFAVADHEGFFILDEYERSISTGQLVTGEPLPVWGERIGTRTVHCTTVDALTQTYGPPDLLQVDVEGSEVFVLAGAARTIAEHHPVVHIEIHNAANEEQVRTLLPGYDLTKLTHGDYVAQGGPVHLNHFWLTGRWHG